VARVITPATPPRAAAFPKVGPIVGVAAFATFVLGAMWIMLAELFSGRALRPVAGEGEEPAIGLPPRSAPPPEDEIPAEMLDAALIDMQPAAADTAPDPAETVAPPAVAEDDFSVTGVARQMMARDNPVAAVISPDGDAGSLLTVSLARALADKGRSVILIDMTGTALPTLRMADQPRLPGITDLLAGGAAFGETIHPDRESTAHVMPHGIGDTELAMRGAERLTMIVDALADAYQHVIVECGAAPVASISRLGSLRPATLVLSLPEPDEARLETALAECAEAGFADVVLLCRDAPAVDTPAVAA
jgi:Mrp family chromosome partitioning ATPase